MACAGSGKTASISERVAELIKKGVKPNEIVAFTFTEKAAEELKSRIRTILDRECPSKADFGDMYIGTIHSFCFQMLQELDPKYKNYGVLDPAKRVAYISKKNVFSKLKLWPFMTYSKSYEKKGTKLKYYTVINRFIESVDLIMMEDIPIDDIVDDHGKDHLKESYIMYLKLLEEDKYLDFSSMIYRLVKLLETDPNARLELNSKIKHLIVDEYQDVNIIQEKLIEFIAEGTDSLCVVGDDDQCIYHWNGSFIENILTFDDRYSEKEEVEDVALDINFRSTKAVIYTAREFIKNNNKRLEIKNMSPSSKLKREFEEGDIIYHHLEKEENEHEFILKKIKSLLGTDFIDKRNRHFSLSPSDFAVLVRRNEDAANIVEYLYSEGIQCIAYSGSSIFERKEVLLAMNCLSYLFECQSYIDYNWTPTLNDLKKQYVQTFVTEYPEADADNFISSINTLKKEIDQIFNKFDEKKDYLGELGLQAIYHKILSCFGTQNFELDETFSYNLAVLSTAISDYESVWVRLRASEVEGFFQFAKAYGKGKYMDSKFADAANVDAVKVLTIHKAKGLEFPVVFIPGNIKKRKPRKKENFLHIDLYDFDRYFGDEEDDRRVFYTALTRSEKYIFITSTDWRKNTTKKPYPPHPFVKELDTKYISEDMDLNRSNSGYAPKLHYNNFFPTSFSELTTFDRCPHDFLLRHVYGFNAGVPAAFGYGTNIHNILNKIHKDFIRSKKIPSDNDIDKIFKQMFYLRYATPKITENMEKGAKKVVKNYVDVQKGEFDRILETEKRFEFVLKEALISGQIDLLKKVDTNGDVTEVEIIDFKTEGQRSNTLYELDYEKQLRLYSIACLESLGLSPQKACIHHLDKGNSRSYVDISKDKLKETKVDIQKSVQDILNKNFKPCPSGFCLGCDYRYLCPFKDKPLSI